MHRATLACLVFIGLLAQPFSAQEGQIWRIPGTMPDPSDPAVKAIFDNGLNRGRPLNIVMVSSISPKIGKAKNDYVASLRTDGIIPGIYRELAIMRTSIIVGAEYESVQHRIIAKSCGVSDAQLAALANWKGSSVFDSKQQALLAFVDEMDHGGNVSDATFATLQKFFNPREIVEIANAVSMYYGTGLFTNALQIRLETDGRAPAAGRC